MEREITKEHIKEAVEYVFRQRSEVKSERTFKLRQYCKTNGTLFIDTSTPFINLCGDPECTNCRNFNNMFEECVQKEIDKLNGV